MIWGASRYFAARECAWPPGTSITNADSVLVEIVWIVDAIEAISSAVKLVAFLVLKSITYL